MDMPAYFEDFLTNIRPDKAQIEKMREAHTTLQRLIREDQDLAPLVIEIFIQGSYRRHTALKAKDTSKADVDVVVVTRFDKDKHSPREVLDAFKPFLEKHYKGQYEAQGRSWGINVSDKIKLDLVPTAIPSENMQRILSNPAIGVWLEESSYGLFNGSSPKNDPIFESIREIEKKYPDWQMAPLDIPDRDANKWDQTHPLAQIKWTIEKNRDTNGFYVNIVKAIKWWRRETVITPKYPKGYPLEHLIGANCSNDVQSIADGIVSVLEESVDAYADYVAAGRVPYLHDHGFPETDTNHNVMSRVSASDFAKFYEKLKVAACLAREALDETTSKESAKLWQKLFGMEFPSPPDVTDSNMKGGFTQRSKKSEITNTPRFA